MRPLAPLFLLLALGCGAAHSAEARSGGESDTAVAQHDEVCSSYDGSVSRPCAAGLECCYPCGTDGCDSVCHTPAECDVDRMRPSAPPPD